MHAIAFFEKRIDTMQLSHFRDIIGQRYTGTHPDIEFVKCFTPVRFPKFSNLPKKAHKLLHFFAKNRECKMFYSCIFQQIVSLFANFTQLQSHSSYFVKKLSLNMAKLAKIFDTSATCDKFHVCHQRALILKDCSLMTSSLETTK